MTKLDNKELDLITGGSGVSGTIINAITNLMKVIFNIGEGIGSSVRRMHEDKLCSID